MYIMIKPWNWFITVKGKKNICGPFQELNVTLFLSHTRMIRAKFMVEIDSVVLSWEEDFF